MSNAHDFNGHRTYHLDEAEPHTRRANCAECLYLLGCPSAFEVVTCDYDRKAPEAELRRRLVADEAEDQDARESASLPAYF